MINIFNLKKQITLKKAEFKESLVSDNNPSRGWYRVYHYKVEEQLNEDIMKSVLRQDEQLSLVEINIGSYNDRPLDDYALGNIKFILDFWKRNKKEIILRVIYDNEGKGMEKEPSSINIVEQHMNQTGRIFAQYKDIIFAMQGIFVGSWGEMHTSKFVSKNNIIRLINNLYDSTEGKCVLSVRKPVQWRMIYGINEDQINRELFNDNMRIGLYNDAIMGSESDMGTYAECSESKDIDEAWNRQNELAFQDELCRFVPCGGETVNDNELNDISSAIPVLRKMHITYLHSIYDINVINKWKSSKYVSDDCFNGVTGYDYVSAHLGYRFVIRDINIVKARKNTADMTVTIENTGFANIYDDCSVYAVVINEDGEESKYPLQTDILSWDSGKKTDISFSLSFENPGIFNVYLMTERKKDGRIIKFANQHAEDMTLAGSFTYSK